MTQSQKVLLVVEDEDPIRLTLRDILTFEGFSVLESKDGKDGLTKALEAHPDLILLDLVMPKMDGLTMLKKIREDAWGKNARVIVLTNIDDRQALAETLGEDVSEYFVKSDVRIEEVVARVKEKLGAK